MADIRQHPLYAEDLDRILPAARAFAGKTFLVTGATGLLGSFLCDVLTGAGASVIACGRSRKRAMQRLGSMFGSGLFRFLEHDASEPFPSGTQADFIIPLASNTHPRAYSESPVETLLVNVDGARHALELALRCDATVIYPSSVEVYGNSADGSPFREEDTGQLNLSNARACYPEAKRCCEALCQSYIAQKGVLVKIARLSRIFGPTMLTSDTKASSQFILKAVRRENIVLKSEGTQRFSYTYVADAAGALLHILASGAAGVPYNVAAPACNVTLKDFALMCAACAGTEVVFELPQESERRGYSVAQNALLDSSRLIASGWTPLYDMQDAVGRTVSILRDSLF